MATAPRRTAAVQEKKALFLDAYVEEGTILHAAKRSGIGRQTHYDWINNDPEYVARFQQAREEATQMLEREARRRAIEGTRKPVYHQGKVVDTVLEYSDTLLIFLMKAARPGVYRERVDMTLDIRSLVTVYAAENGLNEAEVMAEAERLLTSGR
jgi:hypothetical protein